MIGLKYIFLSLFFLNLSSVVYTQEQKSFSDRKTIKTEGGDFPNFKDRLYFGGNVGAFFGSTTYISISPLIGCKITKPFSVGVGFTYNYYSQRYQGRKYVSTIYGGNIFARYFILENIFAQVGWDRLSVVDPSYYYLNKRTWVDNILVGGGYRQAFSNRGSFVATVFYNINQTPLSPYPNPIIQIGFNAFL